MGRRHQTSRDDQDRGTPIDRDEYRQARSQEAGPAGVRLSGAVKRLVGDKGFGFIRDASGVEYFFHRSQCPDDFDTLKEGTKVTFVTATHPKGPRAESVSLAQ